MLDLPALALRINRLTAQQVAAEVEATAATIEGLKRVIATTQTTLTNDRMYLASVADYEKKIQLFTKQLNDLKDARLRGPEIIANARQQLGELGAQLRVLNKHKQLRELIELQVELSAK